MINKKTFKYIRPYYSLIPYKNSGFGSINGGITTNPYYMDRRWEVIKKINSSVPEVNDIIKNFKEMYHKTIIKYLEKYNVKILLEKIDFKKNYPDGFYYKLIFVLYPNDVSQNWKEWYKKRQYYNEDESIKTNIIYKKSIKMYGIVISVLDRLFRYYPTYFVLYKEENRTYELLAIDFIGVYSSQDVLIKEGMTPDKLHAPYNINQLFQENNISGWDSKNKNINENYENEKSTIKEINNIIEEGNKRNIESNSSYEDSLKLIFNKNIKGSYYCFPSINKEKKQEPYKGIFTPSQLITCPYEFTYYGLNKSDGVWDLPCIKNEDCPYYKSNKNYKNEYGGCKINGYCEFPDGLEYTGFRQSLSLTDKPLCYNCYSKGWLPQTALNSCCEEQKDRKLYPHLSSPDYAFKNDINNRYVKGIYD